MKRTWVWAAIVLIVASAAAVTGSSQSVDIGKNSQAGVDRPPAAPPPPPPFEDCQDSWAKAAVSPIATTYRIQICYKDVKDVLEQLAAFKQEERKLWKLSGHKSARLEALEDAVIKVETARNQLIVSLAPQHYREFVCLIANLDAAPGAVQLEIVIAEVDLPDGKEVLRTLGIGLDTSVHGRDSCDAKKCDEVIQSLAKQGRVRIRSSQTMGTIPGKTGSLVTDQYSVTYMCMFMGYGKLYVESQVQESSVEIQGLFNLPTRFAAVKRGETAVFGSPIRLRRENENAAHQVERLVFITPRF
jgi:hypothetical protein